MGARGESRAASDVFYYSRKRKPGEKFLKNRMHLSGIILLTDIWLLEKAAA